MVKHLGVVGAGTMGSGIAQIAALAGIEVSLYDINATVLRQALEKLKTRLRSNVEQGVWTESDLNETIERLHPRTRLAELSHSDIVIEAVIEDLRIKKDLLRHLEADTKPTTILASTSSSLSITALASATRHPEKVLGVHFIGSPVNGGFVEIVAGEGTSAETIRYAQEFLNHLGKSSIVVHDAPGFVVHRLLNSFFGESLAIVGENIADHEQIDRIVKLAGSFEHGPFESMDEAGIDLCLQISETLFAQTMYDPRHRPHMLLKQMVDSGKLGNKSGAGFYSHVNAGK